MSDTYPGEKIVKKFEFAAVFAVGLLLLLSITIAIFVLYVLFIDHLRMTLTAVHSVKDMQVALQKVFAGVLLVLLGLELIETLKTYFTERQIRIEMILIVAMISVGWHILNIDLEQMSRPALLGAAALLLAIAVSYFLVKRTHINPGSANQERGD
jgi:uncharacterized membrane protein (DUF373 family)